VYDTPNVDLIRDLIIPAFLVISEDGFEMITLQEKGNRIISSVIRYKDSLVQCYRYAFIRVKERESEGIIHTKAKGSQRKHERQH
jgi:uncharacterized spore protein YtfJ